MKFKRTLGLVLAALMVMSSFSVSAFAATQTIQPTKTTNIVSGTPTIDGTITGTEWDNAEKVDFPYDRNGCSATNLAVPATYAEGKEPYAMTMWDEDYLYAYFRVYDDAIITEGSPNAYLTDSVELYIDELNEKGNTTDECTRFYQITVRADGGVYTPTKDYSADNFKTTINTDEGYYDVEMRYAWNSLTPSADSVIGIDFAINNTNEADATRDNSFSWNDQTNELWKAPVYAGFGVLVGSSSAVNYRVDYDANGGSNAPAAQTKEENVALTLSDSVPTRAAFAFKGWSTTADGEVEYAAGATYTANADVTLYAVWELDIDEEARELPEDATLLNEGWVPNSALADTQIKWQAYKQGSDTVLKFTYWPEETENAATSVIAVVNATTGKGIGYGKGEDLAWGEYEAKATKVIIGEGITGIGGAAFMTFDNIKTIEITEDLVSVVGAAFEGCWALNCIYYAGNEPVSGEADLTTIPTLSEYALDSCNSITSVKLNPNYSGAIGKETFKSTKITEISIPAGVTSIAAEAFDNCTSLTKVVINGMKTTVAQYAFANDGTGKNDRKDSVTIYCYAGSVAEANAKEYGFKYELLDGGVIPDPDPDPDENIVTGHAMAYYDNSVMADVTWTLNRTTGLLTLTSNKTGYAESGAQNSEGGWKDYLAEIKEVVIQGNVSKITGNAFSGAVNLEKVTMPAVTQIDAGAFSGCSKLKTVVIAGSPEMAGVLDFSTIMGSNAKGTSSFAQAKVFNTDTVGTAIILSNRYSDDVIAEGQTEAPTLKLANLPANIKTIYGATEYLENFAEENDLEFVPFGKSTDKNIYWTIKDGVMTLIGAGALNGLDTAIDAYADDVTKVIIPATVTEIADGALAALTNLESVTFNGDAPTVAADAKPFGERDAAFTVIVKSGAEGFDDDTWCGYTLVKMTYVAGDINDDGEINTMDAVLLAQYLAGWSVTINENAADTNGDGVINTMDAVLLAQYLAKWNVTLVGGSQPEPNPEPNDFYGDNEI